jgi:hypothetical protein
MLVAAEEMLAAGLAAGAVRADLQPYDLLRLGHAVGMVADLGTAADSERMIDIMLVGLHTEGTRP